VLLLYMLTGGGGVLAILLGVPWIVFLVMLTRQAACISLYSVTHMCIAEPWLLRRFVAPMARKKKPGGLGKGVDTAVCICIGLEGWQALRQLLQCLSGAVEATVYVELLQLASYSTASLARCPCQNGASVCCVWLLVRAM
jgi:hypothetical protein